MGMTNSELLTVILKELRRAEEKHSWDNNTLSDNCLIFIEEAGEVARAVNQYNQEGGIIEAVRDELIQTGAMVLRMLKNLPTERKPNGSDFDWATSAREQFSEELEKRGMEAKYETWKVDSGNTWAAISFWYKGTDLKGDGFMIERSMDGAARNYAALAEMYESAIEALKNLPNGQHH